MPLSSTTASKAPIFQHTPTPITKYWLLLSTTLVTWDFLYVFLRPYSLPEGSAHFFWKPYALYGKVDYVYSAGKYWEGEGFVGAQSALNVVECICYWYYLGGVRDKKKGKDVRGAVLVGWAGAVMTLSKTALYWLNESFSGFANIGHNDWWTLLTMWIIPNGLWIIFPAYMIWTIGKDILQAMNEPYGKEE